MKTNEIALGTLKQSQVRDSIELAIRFKRQRAATEALHKLAREKGVKLVIDVIAQPCQVSWIEGWLRVYYNLYVIFSKDEKKLFGYDMTDGHIFVLDNKDIRVEPLQSLKNLPYRGFAKVELGIPQLEKPDGTSSPCIRVPFRFGAWYVLEILQNGHFFYAQREKTAKLRQYADEHELDYHVHFKDKLASRAKLATVDGKTYWSLRCEAHATGTVCYVLYDEETDSFTVTGNAPQIWVLQQRNAWKKMKAFAKERNYELAETRSFLAQGNGHTVWALPVAYGGYVICRVRTGETAFVDEVTNSLAGKMDGSPLDCVVCGLDVKATCWLEAEFVKDPKA